MKNKIGLKVVSSALLCTMLAYTVPVFGFTKEETVYSKLDVNGVSYNTIVSTHIKNEDNQELINDLTDLINIENTNGDEKFTQDGTSIVWQSNKNDIYYQGESKKELPILCTIKYELDGKQIEAKDIAGKTGKVKITLEYTNKDEHIVNINGKNEKMYTPFIAVAGTIIKNENNKNITITNGKVIDDGSKSIVMGIALPGMQESLNVSKDTLNIPNTIEVTMDATDFEMNNIITFVTPKVLEESDLEFFDNLDKIYTKLDTLQSSMKEIREGANSLAEGASTLKDGVNTAYNGSKQIQSEVSKATNKLASDKSDALDTKTLSQIEAQASNVATKAIESQKEAIGKQAASNAASQIESQKEAIGKQAASNAASQIESQKEAIGKQAVSNAASQIESQKETIGKAAKKQALAELDAETIGQKAASQAGSYKLTQDQINKIVTATIANAPNYAKLSDNEKAKMANIIKSIAATSASITTSQVATGVANNTAQTVAKEVAGQVADKTAQNVASQISSEVANKTAQTVASQISSEVANKTAQTVASQTASEVANKTASEVASQTAKSTAKQTASTTAKSVANEVKSAATNKVVSQMNTLGNGLNELSLGLSQINEGTTTLKEGANSLAEGLTKFDEEGISKICGYINGDVKEITQRVEKLKELSKQYVHFTMLDDGNEGNAKFIMIIDSIKKQEAEDNSKEEIITDNRKEN